jgi:hypothetical protein
MYAKDLLVLIAVGALAVAGAVALVDRSASCDVLADRDLFDVIMDFDESDPKPTMEEAAEAAFVEAGMPRDVEAADLDPIVRAHPDGNLVHLGVDGYWVELASTQDGDGFVWVERPRPCSILERSAELLRDRRASGPADTLSPWN